MKSELKQKKMTAAISAVYSYLRSEEDAAALAQAMTEPLGAEEVAVSLPVQVKLWGISGRQDIMSMRTLMQLRTFARQNLR